MGLTKAKYLSSDEHASLINCLTKYESSDFRNTTFLWMLLHTGARVSEVLAIRPQDLVFEGMSVFITGLKDSKDRELPLTPWLFNRMSVLAKGTSPGARIFSFSYTRARDIWTQYRPVAKKMHSLRHTRALEIYRRHRDIRLVQRVLGHRSLTSTLVYTEYDYNQDELRKAML
jgi:integrase